MNLLSVLPQSVIALLQADRFHRQSNPVGAELSAKIRWSVADALDCPGLGESAKKDLQHADERNSHPDSFASLAASVSSPEQDLLRFSRKLTLAAYSITDADVEVLIEHWGVAKFVAVVHTIAFANFLARIMIGHQLRSEEAELRDLLHDENVDEKQSPLPLRVNRNNRLGEVNAEHLSRCKPPANWSIDDFPQVEVSLLEQQRQKCRVPIPTAHQLAHLSEAQRSRSERVVWSRVSWAYQPELTSVWFELMDAFQAEAQLDAIFSNSLFLVVTRSNECFY